ncbi:RHS repeat protein [Taibaiella helva]|uniref:RHS repeat protein n=1 Tax=Taibaiella helva TaxID=2301235 RepID=UPI000E572F23|nr:RHS repeat protein [Taibaiella helva]
MSSLYTPNLYDGSANISIPIYSYSNEAGSFGISFGYNTKGVKVDEISSSVGLHFGLNCELSISRQVKGLPDELSAFPYDTVWASAATKYNRFRGRLASSFDQGADVNDPTIYRDRESDEFVVNAGGLSFSFNIGTGRQIYTNPNRAFKVAILSEGQDYAAAVQQAGGTIPDPLKLEFLITDLQGNQYHFIAGDYTSSQLYAEMDGNINQGPIDNYYNITRWVADWVTLADGKQIRYTYSTRSSASAAVYWSYSYRTGSYASPPGVGQVDQGQYAAYIRKIQYPNGVTADFFYDTTGVRCDYNGGMVLREINIGSGGNCTRYQLDQSYTVVKTGGNTASELSYGSPCINISSVPSTRSHRLRLNGIRMLSCDGTVSEPLYTFSYDPTELPLRFSAGQDYFGYYNGRSPVPYGSTNDTNISIPRVGSMTFGANRTEDVSKMKAGVLTAIRNAYGGTVNFVYGAHQLVTPAALSSLLPTDNYFLGKDANDGLCLTSIIETDEFHQGNNRTTSFNYIEGQRFLTGGYFHYPQRIQEVNNPGTYPGGGYLTNTYLSPHHLVAGSNHGYSFVSTTVIVDGYTASRRDIRFTNFTDALSSSKYVRVGGGKHFFEFPYADKQYLREWEMGLPLEIKDYDRYGNLVERSVNEYSFIIDSTSAIDRAVQNTKYSFVQDNSVPAHTGTGPGINFAVSRVPVTDPYKPFNGEAQLIRSTSYKYLDNTNYTTDVATFQYDDHKNLKATITTNSNDEEIWQFNLYNYDLTASIGGSTYWTPFFGQERLMAAQRWKRTTSGSMPQNGVLLDAYFTGFGVPSSSGNAQTWPYTRNMYQYRGLEPVTYTQYLSGAYNTDGKKAYAAYNSQDDIPYFTRISEVTRFDVRGNPLETWLPEGQQYKAMIWDSISGQKIAEAVNSRYTDIAYTSFETNAYNTNFTYTAKTLAAGGVTGGSCLSLWNNVTNVSNQMAGTQPLQQGKEYVLSFWARGTVPMVTAGGVVQTLPAPVATVNNSWRQYIIRFTPQTSGTIVSFSGTAANSYLDEVRLYPAAARMTSQTYAPLFGLSSETDVNGRFATYSYDALGRQTLVRDQEGQIRSKTQYTVKGAE